MAKPYLPESCVSRRTAAAWLPPFLAIAAILISLACTSRHVSAASTAQSRGAELFATSGCPRCHGPAGVGGGRGPDLQLVRNRMTAERINQQIHDGGGAMPPYADALQTDQIADLVAYLRAKRKHIVPVPRVAPAPVSPALNPDDDAAPKR